VSLVSEMDECPRRLLTTASGTPAASSRDACPCHYLSLVDTTNSTINAPIRQAFTRQFVGHINASWCVLQLTHNPATHCPACIIIGA